MGKHRGKRGEGALQRELQDIIEAEGGIVTDIRVGNHWVFGFIHNGRNLSIHCSRSGDPHVINQFKRDLTKKLKGIWQ